ncbi:hypothetical protein BGX21_009863 [Mortierella sp. AD011]|nr:hypothetical protein BGX21_009863 [Mortierella sp. AD011]
MPGNFEGAASIAATTEPHRTKTCNNTRLQPFTQDLEWQALHLAVKTCHVDNADNNKKGAMEIESDYAYDGDDDNTESILARFVTKANVTHLQDAIRTEQIWGSEHGHRVGNIQAKKISEMNAIQMSVELAAGDVPSS